MTDSNGNLFGKDKAYTSGNRHALDLYGTEAVDKQNAHTDVDDNAPLTNDLYGYQRDDDEHEPFAYPQPATGEPLFPTTPARPESAWADNTWIEATPQSVIYDHAYQNQTHDSQDYLKLDYSAPDMPSTAAAGEDTSIPHMPVAPEGLGSQAAAASAENHVASHAESPPHDNAANDTASLPPMFEFAPAVDQAQPSPAAPVSERDLLFSRHFALLTSLMQHGAWPQAVEKLQTMRAEFPEVSALDSLLDEATLKAELMATWTHKIKGRRLTVGQEWLIRRSLPFLALVTLFICSMIFYQSFVAPSRQVVAMERANQALLEEAAGLLKVGQIDEAIGLFSVVLDRNPDNVTAQQGLADASRLVGLATTYDLAIRVANKGNLERSLRMLQSIKANSPAFRDIDARITRVTSLLEAEVAYQQAEQAFAQHRWADAITHYEATQRAASDYQAVRVGLQVSAAYFMASQKLMHQGPTPYFGTEQIREFLRRSQEINGRDETMQEFMAQLDDFIRGERELSSNNLASAVRAWQPLYAAQPDFLGGYLAEQLYRAYLALASDVRASDTDYARELYTLAAAMPVHDSSEARTQLQNLGAAAPPVQPTPTPRPTVAFVAPVAAAAPVAVAATPTPEPTATPANAYQGWIAFRSTRDGSEQVYLMREDGSEAQLAPEEVRGRIDTLYQEERRGPDGRMVFVQAATGRSDANLYVAGSDGVTKSEVTTFAGDEYDPVWARTGDRIAFVANHTGNDEIWVMAADGSGPRQLTVNNWEWDKHPTWSPDGNQIAFFSNRSGQRQIWVMAADGSNQRNLSNNGFDDWDPVWIK